MLCFSCYIWNLDYVEQLMDEYHKICPEVPIWVGGPEVSYETEAFLKAHPQVTGAMVGEGEETFLELCENYAKAGAGAKAGKVDFPGIKGIMYRAGESLVKTGAREPLDLNRIPFCYGGVEDFRTASSIMNRAEGVRSGVVTVFPRWKRHCGSGMWSG